LGRRRRLALAGWDLGSALEDLRRLVYALRPPVLDQLGLLGSLREQLPRMSVPVILSTPETLPPLPGAVEIAAYRIVTEAVTNGARHAAGTACTVTIACADWLTLEIRDDGTSDRLWPPGVGMTSMRERATALGGTWRAGPTGAGGRVLVELPLSLAGERNMTAPTSDIRVLIVDDHHIVLEGLAALLASVDGMTVVGEATSGERAIGIIDEVHPDVVLMDIEMPGIGGIEATRRITAAHPNVALVMLTMYGEDEFVFAALRAGARGYLLKGAKQEDVIRIIGGIAKGDAVFGPDVAGRVLQAFANPGPAARPFPQLTDREREILGLMANGWPNGRIARQLSLSAKTIANNVSAILMKLQAPDRSAAIVQARRAGLGDP
jgi:DNA-binding NarL/FixJ family response regulator